MMTMKMMSLSNTWRDQPHRQTQSPFGYHNHIYSYIVYNTCIINVNALELLDTFLIRLFHRAIQVPGNTYYFLALESICSERNFLLLLFVFRRVCWIEVKSLYWRLERVCAFVTRVPKLYYCQHQRGSSCIAELELVFIVYYKWMDDGVFVSEHFCVILYPSDVRSFSYIHIY